MKLEQDKGLQEQHQIIEIIEPYQPNVLPYETYTKPINSQNHLKKYDNFLFIFTN